MASTNAERLRLWIQRHPYATRTKYPIGPLQYQKNLECSKRWKESNKDRIKEYWSRWYMVNREEIFAKQKENRLKILDLLGGQHCAICGYDDDWRALQIDHINGGGTAHRKSLGTGSKYYQSILDNINDFQVLCANCNFIKREENKENYRIKENSI